jgi:hypothetical protein
MGYGKGQCYSMLVISTIFSFLFEGISVSMQLFIHGNFQVHQSSKNHAFGGAV